MSIIKFETENWNAILKKSGKIRIEDFIKWFNQITPQYKYIKEKSVFEKSPKGLWSAKKLPEVNIGEDGLWDKIFFINHKEFLNGFVSELENKGFLYWDEYFKYLNSQQKKSVQSYISVYENAINDKEFLDRNTKQLELNLKNIVELLKSEQLEKMIDITKELLELTNLDSIIVLESLSNLLEKVDGKSVTYHYKNLNFKIDEKLIINNSNISEKLKQKVAVKNIFEYEEVPAILLRKDTKEWINHYGDNSVMVNLILLEFIDVVKDYHLIDDSEYHLLRLAGSYFELICATSKQKNYKQLKIGIEFLLDTFRNKKEYKDGEFKALLENLLISSEVVTASDKKNKIIKF